MAGETDYLVTNIGHLIEAGKLEADNERGEYINPVDRSSMLCDVIRITKENGNYKGSLTQEQNCDYNDLADKNSMVLLKKYDSSNTEILDESATKGWTNTDVTLKVEVKSEYPYENNIKEIKLTGNNTEEVRIVNKDFSSKNSFSVKANQLLNTRYNVEVTFDNEGKIIKYTNSTTVKIDKQRPTLYMDETNIDKESEWTNTKKKVTIRYSDGSGSGVYGYSISGNKDCKSVSYTKTNKNEGSVALGNGTYYICVRDNVRNYSEDISSKSVVVKNVDTTAPIVNVVPSSAWAATNSAVISGTDSESGIIAYSVSKTNSPSSWIGVNNTKNFSVTKSDFTENGTYYAFLKDAVGNIGVKSFVINRVDKNPPSINSFSVSSSNGSYNATSVNLSINASDETSMSMCVSLSGYGVGCSWENYTTSKAFNVGGSLNGEVRTIYLSLKDAAGNVSNKSVTYQVYRECSSSYKTNISGWGTCSKTCGGGTQSRTYQMKDSFTGAVCSNNSESQPCNAQSCCSKTEVSSYGAWGTCNKTCGGGTQSRTIYYKSSYDGSSCGTGTESQSCNTQTCGPKVTSASMPLYATYDYVIPLGNDKVIAIDAFNTNDMNNGSCANGGGIWATVFQWDGNSLINGGRVMISDSEIEMYTPTFGPFGGTRVDENHVLFFGNTTTFETSKKRYRQGFGVWKIEINGLTPRVTNKDRKFDTGSCNEYRGMTGVACDSSTHCYLIKEMSSSTNDAIYEIFLDNNGAISSTKTFVKSSSYSKNVQGNVENTSGFVFTENAKNYTYYTTSNYALIRVGGEDIYIYNNQIYSKNTNAKIPGTGNAYRISRIGNNRFITNDLQVYEKINGTWTKTDSIAIDDFSADFIVPIGNNSAFLLGSKKSNYKTKELRILSYD